jgi:hypothetical protein
LDDRARPQVDWAPETYSAFLSFLLQSVIAQSRAIIAAGHAAAYVLQHAANSKSPATRLVLIAPTWRGPLPTMMGGKRPWFDRLCRLVDRPGSGPLLYRLNVNRFMVRRMGAGHVYCDPSFLTGDRLQEKLAVVRAPGARFGSVRFVTGRLDPLASRGEFLDLARQIAVPIMVIYGADTPPRSRAEMEALADVPGVRTIVLPRGKLAVHEEFPDATYDAIDAFLREELARGRPLRRPIGDGWRSPPRVHLGTGTGPATATAKPGANAGSDSECWRSWPKCKMRTGESSNQTRASL